MIGLAEKVDAVHRALTEANVRHAFGGALALAFCIGDPRATADIDVNVFVSPDRAGEVFAALPDDVIVTHGDLERAMRDGQVRLQWDVTPIDLFFGYHEFHEHVARRVRTVSFGGVPMPFLDCTDLAIFKAIFGRSRDWVDIEAMIAAETVDAIDALRWIADLLGTDSERYQRLAAAFGERPVEESEAEVYQRAFGRPKEKEAQEP